MIGRTLGRYRIDSYLGAGGMAKPDGSDDPEARARNRRVEIVVSKGGRRSAR